MEFKEGLGWKACYDEERNLYTAQRKWRGSYHLYEIDKEIYEQLGIKEEDGYDADKLIMKGRCLFESDDDYYTSPYYTIHDENYHELAPWSSAKWIAEKTDVMNKRDRLVKNFPGLYLCYGTSKVDHIRNVFGVSDRLVFLVVTKESFDEVGFGKKDTDNFNAIAINPVECFICLEINGIESGEQSIII